MLLPASLLQRIRIKGAYCDESEGGRAGQSEFSKVLICLHTVKLKSQSDKQHQTYEKSHLAEEKSIGKQYMYSPVGFQNSASLL